MFLCIACHQTVTLSAIYDLDVLSWHACFLDWALSDDMDIDQLVTLTLKITLFGAGVSTTHLRGSTNFRITSPLHYDWVDFTKC